MKKRIKIKKQKRDKRLDLIPKYKKEIQELHSENFRLKLESGNDLIYFLAEMRKLDDRNQYLNKSLQEALQENYELEEKLFYKSPVRRFLDRLFS